MHKPAQEKTHRRPERNPAQACAHHIARRLPPTHAARQKVADPPQLEGGRRVAHGGGGGGDAAARGKRRRRPINRRGVGQPRGGQQGCKGIHHIGNHLLHDGAGEGAPQGRAPQCSLGVARGGTRLQPARGRRRRGHRGVQFLEGMHRLQAAQQPRERHVGGGRGGGRRHRAHGGAAQLEQPPRDHAGRKVGGQRGAGGGGHAHRLYILGEDGGGAAVVRRPAHAGVAATAGQRRARQVAQPADRPQLAPQPGVPLHPRGRAAGAPADDLRRRRGAHALRLLERSPQPGGQPVGEEAGGGRQLGRQRRAAQQTKQVARSRVGCQSQRRQGAHHLRRRCRALAQGGVHLAPRQLQRLPPQARQLHRRLAVEGRSQRGGGRLADAHPSRQGLCGGSGAGRVRGRGQGGGGVHAGEQMGQVEGHVSARHLRLLPPRLVGRVQREERLLRQSSVVSGQCAHVQHARRRGRRRLVRRRELGGQHARRRRLVPHVLRQQLRRGGEVWGGRRQLRPVPSLPQPLPPQLHAGDVAAGAHRGGRVPGALRLAHRHPSRLVRLLAGHARRQRGVALQQLHAPGGHAQRLVLAEGRRRPGHGVLGEPACALGGGRLRAAVGRLLEAPRRAQQLPRLFEVSQLQQGRGGGRVLAGALQRGGGVARPHAARVGGLPALQQHKAKRGSQRVRPRGVQVSHEAEARPKTNTQRNAPPRLTRLSAAASSALGRPLTARSSSCRPAPR